MNGSLSAERRRKTILSVVLAFICILYLLPVLAVVVNSFKLNTYVKTETFALPTAESFAGWANYIKGVTFGNYPFWKSAFYSLFITLVSTALILLCTSMAAWYIARVDSKLCRGVYYLCVFSMVVPFQMVMFTLSKTADRVKIPYFNFASGSLEKVALNTPWTIPIIYLGFGAGLAIFMFVGFVKSIPIEIEEAAAIDGCGPVRTFFMVVMPMLKPTLISVGILEIMWVWNDFLLPYLVLDRNEYMTIPILIQYLKGSYGTVDLGATMALILLCCSMAAWYIARVGSPLCKIVYYLCIFSMVVPFQMVMFTLARTANTVKIPYFDFLAGSIQKIALNTPWTIPIIYLGFGAGLAIFMFVGFVKSIPLEIEEAAAIDGCGPLRTYFSVVLPMLRPTMISVGILEIMWVWNDYLLPYLVLDRTKYLTIPIHIQYLKGSYGTVDLGATMALILLSIIPVIVFYLLCQKYIIKGVAAGAVKG